ncbi:hypothetical protein [Thiohalocapsa sp. ML1]|uniref:hypothetical protein n=1 Tax=Thiohalocapsa sp. ML1 TaxID=1431688 RepID=UPI0012E3D4A6|nr:hypothetical protein [Thiohalocapsa sp. ML1]
MEDWTAEIAKNMFGDSLYQQRARAALPVLVRQATARQKITYTDLAQELDIPNPRNLNFVLGSVGTTLVELSDRWKEDVPAIQLIVVNQQTGMPGSGVDPMIDAAHVGKLDPRQKEALVDSIQARAFAYPRWSDVLRELGWENRDENRDRPRLLLSFAPPQRLLTSSFDRHGAPRPRFVTSTPVPR